MGAIRTSLPISTFIAEPSAPTVTPTGGAAGHYTYKIVAKLSTGGPGGVGSTHSAASSGTAVTNGPTTLDGTHYETITGTAVPGADGYDVYLTATTSGATLGKIGSCADITVGVVHNSPTQGDGSTAPATNTSGIGQSCDVAGLLADKTIQFSGTFTATMKVKGSIDEVEYNAIGSDVTAVGFATVAAALRRIRIDMTAFTSGAPTAMLAGNRSGY